MSIVHFQSNRHEINLFRLADNSMLRIRFFIILSIAQKCSRYCFKRRNCFSVVCRRSKHLLHAIKRFVYIYLFSPVYFVYTLDKKEKKDVKTGVEYYVFECFITNGRKINNSRHNEKVVLFDTFFLVHPGGKIPLYVEIFQAPLKVFDFYATHSLLCYRSRLDTLMVFIIYSHIHDIYIVHIFTHIRGGISFGTID